MGKNVWCGGLGAGRRFGASQLELFFGKELTSVFVTLLQVRTLVASIMGVWERGWQWEKEYTYQKGFLVVNRVQINNKSLAAIVCRGLLCTMHIREKQKTKPSASFAVFLLSFLAERCKRVPGIVF